MPGNTEIRINHIGQTTGSPIRRKVWRMLAGIAAAAMLAGPAFADPALEAAIKADYDSYLGPLFKHFHENPELSHLEFETSKRMAAELKKAGAVVTTGVGGTGVVGVMQNGAGPVLLIRADMDGLPIEEKSGLPYASKAKQKGLDGEIHPVMQACGHDTHITSMVGAARRLGAMKDKWRGTIIFAVQPAEERVAGAKAMLADGLYTRFPKPDYAVAFHVTSDSLAGKVSASEGLQYSSADSVEITVHGVAAHGAAPHLSKDPVYIGSAIVVALQSIVSREVAPLLPAVITVGAFHAGLKHNVISDRADLQLTVRANDEKTRAFLLAAIDRVAKNVARANGVAEDKLPDVKVIEGTPTTINDTALARRLNAAFAQQMGPDAVIPFVQKWMGAEDFAYFVQPELKVPGYDFLVGGTSQAAIDAENAGGPPVPSNHSPLFIAVPEPVITRATEGFVIAALELLKPK